MADSARSRPTTREVSQVLARGLLALQAAYADASRLVDLTPSQAQLLCAAMTPSPVNDLARTLGCDRSNITHMTHRAGPRGWFTSAGSPADARVRLISTSAAGGELVNELIPHLEARLGGRVQGWTDEDLRCLVDLMRRLSTDLAR